MRCLICLGTKAFFSLIFLVLNLGSGGSYHKRWPGGFILVNSYTIITDSRQFHSCSSLRFAAVPVHAKRKHAFIDPQ